MNEYTNFVFLFWLILGHLSYQISKGIRWLYYYYYSLFVEHIYRFRINIVKFDAINFHPGRGGRISLAKSLLHFTWILVIFNLVPFGFSHSLCPRCFQMYFLGLSQSAEVLTLIMTPTVWVNRLFLNFLVDRCLKSMSTMLLIRCDSLRNNFLSSFS